MSLFSLPIPRPARSTLFPYTTLFRSRACVEAFRRRGAKLALTARSQDKLQDAAGTDALAIAGDLTSGDFRKRVVDTVAGEYGDRKSTRLNSSHVEISYAVFCLKKKKK